MELKPGYKQTEVGVIPEEWETKSLGSVLSKGRLGGNYANQDKEAELPLMKMGNLARGYIDLSKIQFITPGVRPEPPHRLAYGDVLFNTRNTLDLVGKVAIWRDELPVAYYNSNLMRLEFDPEQICSNEYANYALNTEGAVSRLRALATGTTSVAAIYTRDLMKLQVLVPRLPEQRAIASALSDVDGLLGGLDRLVAKKRDLIQAAMQQLLTGQTRLPGFHGDWEVRRLGELGSTYGGLTGKVKADFGEGSARYITFMNVMTSVVIDCGTFEQVQVSPSESQNRVLKGDLFFNGSSETPEEVAMCSVLLDEVHDVYLNSFCFGFRFSARAEADGLFFSYYLRSNVGRDFVKSLAQGSTRYNLSKSALVRSTLQLPSLLEQTAIAEVLTVMDDELAALVQRRDKTRDLKQAMMQELLTGRTRLV
ncbi:restriction endonuclease subunit S [Synechococcus sp. BA-124 BA4]|uniref:restriction endonuclease subunit S n=1 Tax=Synechococcus sp. BA-124 BA4 TaxID=3110251 RepID=UPI002B1F4E36|nr:restriction endonuclease subunit S [Synechococcus sp. BA-124 BA4]MEA5399113.1 restriction endonuclease subunit S [Synechococcus sp. BA-124 BA4]